MALVDAKLPTLGGRQFWGDEFVQAGWRIQSNVITGEFRLLSPKKLRFAHGSFETCMQALIEEHPKPYDGRLVLCLHGLGRSWASMDPLVKILHHKHVDVEALTYPSTRASISDHATRLLRLISRLENVTELDFVTHSLGGIVLREALNRTDSWPPHIHPRRVAMLAPPYHGAALARIFEKWPPVRAVLGETLEELAKNSHGGDVPEHVELLIIAGAMGNEIGLNPLIDGDNDGTVSVRETRPHRAHEFVTVKAHHSLIMTHQGAIKAVADFLERP
ncbi:MAG: alpha/beta hydrolase [Sphingomonadales bacterium]